MGTPRPTGMAAERELLRLALDLGASRFGGRLSPEERALVDSASTLQVSNADDLRRVACDIRDGADPLGDRLCAMRSPEARRQTGAIYTPPAIVQAMVSWALEYEPSRVVDPGCGSGRFAAAILRRDPELAVVALDSDPVATLLARATLAVLGGRRSTVRHLDFTQLELDPISEKTAFIGNPPYVRHHGLSPDTKRWAVRAARDLGYRVSGLAGLHVLFYLAAARLARAGDVISFITSCEWLDVGYGKVVRELMLNGLGGRSLHVIDPRTAVFDDVQTTSVIACAEVGSTPKRLNVTVATTLRDLGPLGSGNPVARVELASLNHWTPVLRRRRKASARRSVMRLGDLVRVSRGIATGANHYFVLTRDQARLFGVEAWCRPIISGADEILAVNGTILDGPHRKVLLDLPREIDLAAEPAIAAYLAVGEQREIPARYLCRHRNPWWHLGRPAAPPIVATYMARQPPAFATNPDGLALLNVAHGLYPRLPMDTEAIAELVQVLNSVRTDFEGRGRTYQGGLEKFEPREMEDLMVPSLTIR